MTKAARDPRNAPGDFYVMADSCLTCCAPEAEAPELIRTGDDGCYYIRQPANDDEVSRAMSAVVVSCIGAHRYGGEDPRIRQRLADQGEAAACDHPLPTRAVAPMPVLNRVRFDVLGIDSAEEVALRIGVKLLEQTRSRIRRLSGNPAEASFHIELRPSVWGGGVVIERLAFAPAWLLTMDIPSTPSWLHDVLVASDATNVRWYSQAEWETGEGGRADPYARAVRS
jgi:hypothetical protein